MQDLRLADVQTIETLIVGAIAREEIVDAFALMVLLRGYRVRGREDLGEALETALSRALATYQNDTAIDVCAAWLVLFSEAIVLSDDERLRTAARHLADQLQHAWVGATSVEEAAAAIDACLRASPLTVVFGTRPLASDAIDALERMVANGYVPGQGMSHTHSGPSRGPQTRGAVGDQVRAASALLTAYEVSGRLPYSMLAEELIQLKGQLPLGDDLVLNCEAARVLGRLAALHDNAEYRAAAVVAPGADYRGDARRILALQSSQALARGAGGAIYALALLELEFPDSYDD